MPVSVYNGPPRPPKPDPNIDYVVTKRDRDDAYPSLAHRRKKVDVSVFIKESNVLEGQDREGGFVFALRNLYKTIEFPEVEMLTLSKESGEMKVDGEFVHTSRQLIGLPEFGSRTYIRDEKTHEVITRVAVEQCAKKRLFTRQVYFNHFERLTEAESPRELCEALRDAIHGLLNAFRMGYVHREIRPEHVVISRGNNLNRLGFMLSKDGKSVEMPPRFSKGFIFDFTVCKKINGEDDQYDGDTENFEISGTTANSIIKVEKFSEYVHSPTYDLESFLWLLLVTASEIICDYMAGRRKVRLDDPKYLATRAAKEEKAAVGNQSEGCSAPGSFTSPSSQGIKEHLESGKHSEKSNDEVMPVAGDHAQAEPQESGSAEVPMDVDGNKEAAEQEKTNDKDEKTDDESKRDELEERKRKRDSESDSEGRRNAKGKQKASVGADEEDETSDEEWPHPNIWYYKKLSPNMMISVIKPFEFKPPAGFTPPGKPQYVAFAEDRMAHVVNALLNPTELGIKFTFAHFRFHLLQKLDYFLSNSAGLGPFRPLAMELRALSYLYYVRHEQISQMVFSREELEEAFARYLRAFDMFMPQEDSWNYLKEYEGSDILYKFDHDRFLGGFVSPTHYKPS